MAYKAVTVGAMILLLSLVGVAEVKSKFCAASVQFVDQNMLDYSITVRHLHGRVVDLDGVGVPSCVALFNSDHSTLLQSFDTNDSGEFIRHLKRGNYWLVVTDAQRAFCPAAARLQIRRLKNKSKILVRMRTRGIDSCSYCEVK